MKVLALPLLVAAARAFTVSPPSSLRHPIRLNLYNTVEEAITDAQRICAAEGPASPECRVAWDIVEELEAADAHRGPGAAAASQQQGVDPQSADYVAFMGSFDILCQKIDGKMDQLQATTDKLVELGADDPSVPALGDLAMQMKQALAYTRSTFQ
mmetsp:Transcript_305/g.860  ORF Transcript_305/g.860 Transcript_305/m.860 type:complete len:155 (-) Transcript_305:636-1100(-)